MFPLLLAVVAQLDCTVVIDEQRPSKVLCSEWNNDRWPLGCLKSEIEGRYDVSFVDYRQSLIPGPFPAVIVRRQRLGTIRCAASGDALRSLHERLMKESSRRDELFLANEFEFRQDGGWAWRAWNDDGSPIVNDGSNGPDESVAAPEPPEEAE